MAAMPCASSGIQWKCDRKVMHNSIALFLFGLESRYTISRSDKYTTIDLCRVHWFIIRYKVATFINLIRFLENTIVNIHPCDCDVDFPMSGFAFQHSVLKVPSMHEFNCVDGVATVAVFDECESPWGPMFGFQIRWSTNQLQWTNRDNSHVNAPMLSSGCSPTTNTVRYR